MLGLIDFYVNEFKEGGFWVVSALAHKEPVPGDDSPEEYDFTESGLWTVRRDTEEEALDVAKVHAAEILRRRTAGMVTIFLNGNEYLHQRIGSPSES